MSVGPISQASSVAQYVHRSLASPELLQFISHRIDPSASDNYRMLLNWVNNRPEITWNDGMDPTQRQAIVPVAPPGGGVSQPSGNNNNITEIP